jgi:hypothetical protein
MAEVGGARIAIEYGRPSKRGRQIWGALVPYGEWWMPGADEATSFVVSHPIQLGSLRVPAGEYTLYTAPAADRMELIVNRATGVFHTQYRSALDLGRVEMTMRPAASLVERLTFAVSAMPSGGALEMSWDDRVYAVPITAGGGRP